MGYLNIFFNKHIIIIFQNHIALVIQEIVGIPRFGVENVGKKLKVETLAHQFGSGGFRFSFHIQFRQNSVIFTQFVVDIAHIIGAVLIYFVIVSIATAIAAELFVLATYNRFSTFKACFHGVIVLYSTSVQFFGAYD